MTTAEPVAPPPSYDGGPLDWNGGQEFIPPASDLPAYTPSQRPTSSARAVVRREPKEFYYELKRNGKLFAALTMISDAAYSRHMATFLEGTPLKGRVRLALDKPDSILSVAVLVSARLPQRRRKKDLSFSQTSINFVVGSWSIYHRRERGRTIDIHGHFQNPLVPIRGRSEECQFS